VETDDLPTVKFGVQCADGTVTECAGKAEALALQARIPGTKAVRWYFSTITWDRLRERFPG